MDNVGPWSGAGGWGASLSLARTQLAPTPTLIRVPASGEKGFQEVGKHDGWEPKTKSLPYGSEEQLGDIF